jgi:large subunit ribosomal protein L9
MKIILMKDVVSLGKEGDIVEVREGYARNYLIPKGFACEASDRNVRKIEEIKKRVAQKREKAIKEAEQLARKLNKLSITIETKAGEEEKLFGTVTTEDIAQAIKTQHDIDVDRHQIYLEEPIKKLGIYKVPIHLIEGINAELKVWVVQAQ